MAMGRSFVFRVELGPRRRRRRHVGFEARHVPQLLWEPVFDELFAHSLPATNRDVARSFCSMALVKLSGR